MCREDLLFPDREPAVLLVLSGCVTYARSGQNYGAGEVFTLEDGGVLRGNARLWYFSGQEGLLKDLRHFSAQLTRKDFATAAHAARVARLAAAIGCYLGLGKARLKHLGLAAYLHDLGKLTLPTTLLQTPEPLTPGEWASMKQHPCAGKRLLEKTSLAFLGLTVARHHERRNGSGYPFGLRGDEVGLESYIIAVADTFDAMTNNRPYRCAQRPQEALDEINHYSGIHYPYEVVAAFNAVIDDFMTSNVTGISAQAVR